MYVVKIPKKKKATKHMKTKIKQEKCRRKAYAK